MYTGATAAPEAGEDQPPRAAGPSVRESAQGSAWDSKWLEGQEHDQT